MLTTSRLAFAFALASLAVVFVVDTSGCPAPASGEGEGEGEGGEGEGGEGEGEGGEGEGEGAPLVCLTAGTVLTVSGGSGNCSTPFAVTVPSTGTFQLQTGAAANNGNNSALDACAPPGATTARDLLFAVTLPNTATTLTASVDATNGGEPIVGIHSAGGCDNVTQCATTENACAVTRGTAGVDFTGPTIFVNVSEVTTTTNDYTLHLEVE